MPPHMEVTIRSGLAAPVLVMWEVNSVVPRGAHASETICAFGISFWRAASKWSWNQRPKA